MSTLPPPKINEFPENSIEKKVYSIVDSLENYIPLLNDRNRLSFALLNFLNGKGDPPEITVKNNKLKFENITEKELAEKLTTLLDSLK